MQSNAGSPALDRLFAGTVQSRILKDWIRIRFQYTVKWGAQMVGMNFQTRSRQTLNRPDSVTGKPKAERLLLVGIKVKK